MAEYLEIMPHDFETKFQVGDVIKDSLIPFSETWTVVAIEKVKENPFVANVWYFLESNRGKRSNGLQEIIEGKVKGKDRFYKVG